MKITRALVILAHPTVAADRKESIVQKLCKTFAETCQSQDITVDFVDLYNEVDFNPVHNPEISDTKSLEYQIRIRKAQLVVIFHPVWLGSVPAILKGFLDKTMTSGFAYKAKSGVRSGLLGDKRFLVFSVSQDSFLEQVLLSNFSLKNFWERSIFRKIGARGEYFSFTNLRRAKPELLNKWQSQVESIAKKINQTENIFELF